MKRRRPNPLLTTALALIVACSSGDRSQPLTGSGRTTEVGAPGDATNTRALERFFATAERRPVRVVDGVFVVESGDGASSLGSTASPRIRKLGGSVRANLPPDAASPFEIRTTDGFTVHVSRAFARSSAAQVTRGALMYRDAWASVDATVLATATGVEELLVAHDAASVKLGYRVDLPAGFTLAQPLSGVGLVELRDGAGRARLRFTALASWDARGASVKTNVAVEGDTITLDVPQDAAFPVTIDPEWRSTEKKMGLVRTAPTATLLHTGKVLIVGGDPQGLPLAELYDPQTETFENAQYALLVPRQSGHTATLLPSGKVLVAGGTSGPGACAADASACASSLSEAELYDPDTQKFEPLRAKLVTPRTGHAATLLPDGSVLLSGGDLDSATKQSTTEIFDPNTKTFQASGLLAGLRAGHSATLLASGKVLIVSAGASVPSAEIFDPVAPGKSTAIGVSTGTGSVILGTGGSLGTGGGVGSGGFKSGGGGSSGGIGAGGAAGSVGVPITVNPGDQAAYLPSGAVAFASAIYDPGAGEWVSTNCPTVFSATASARNATLLPTGDVLFNSAGGATLLAGNGSSCIDVSTSTSSTGGSGPKPVGPPDGHPGTAVLLPTGAVLIAGGGDDSASLLLPVSEHQTSTGGTNAARTNHAAALLSSGEVLLAGGTGDPSGAETYDPQSGHFERTGAMTTASPVARAAQGPGGLVAVAGANAPLEWFHPSTRTFSNAPSAYFYANDVAPFDDHHLLLWGGNASLLDFGTGQTTAINQAIYNNDPSARLYGWRSGVGLLLGASGAELITASSIANIPFSPVLPHVPAVAILSPDAVFVASGRQANLFNRSGALVPVATLLNDHGDGATATLLQSGKVLIAGGDTAAAELFDPATATVTAAKPMVAPRSYHTATLLPLGQVFVSSDGTAENYDPTKNAFIDAAVTPAPRDGQSATLLWDGRVLFAGGEDASKATRETLIYDPATEQKTPGPDLQTPRAYHTATLLASGEVLLTGGDPLGSAELVSRDALSTYTAGSLRTPRAHHAATWLPSGNILITGGLSPGGARLKDAELFNPDPATGTSALAPPPFTTPRADHAAVLLPSGKVLLVGGTEDGLSGLELFDPSATNPVPALVAAQKILGPVHALVLPGDDVLVYGDRFTFRYVLPTVEHPIGTVANNRSGLTKPFGLAPLVPGGFLACAPAGCEFRMSAESAPETVSPLASAGGSLLSILGNEVLLRAKNAIGGGYMLRYGRVPDGVSRPELANPGRVVAGTVVQVRARGLTHMTAVGSAGTGVRPEVFPTLYFVPAATGTPISFGPVSFTDDLVTFRVPATFRSGPGWVYAVVAGVPSTGAFMVIEPAPNGAACTFPADCKAGHCVENMCCDQECTQGCQACTKALTGGADGLCLNIPEGDNPRSGCLHTSNVCSSTGTCNGIGDCDYPPPNTPCPLSETQTGVCTHALCIPLQAGVCTVPPTSVQSPDGKTTTPCGDYLCVDGVCRTSCVNSGELGGPGAGSGCQPWAACNQDNRCAPACSADGTAVLTDEGLLTDGGIKLGKASCSPYTCELGKCRGSCTSHAHCAEGYRCGTSERCEPDHAIQAASSPSCACRLSGSTERRPRAPSRLIELVAFTLAARRLRGRSRRRESRP